jgi:hypothetical protein
MHFKSYQIKIKTMSEIRLFSCDKKNCDVIDHFCVRYYKCIFNQPIANFRIGDEVDEIKIELGHKPCFVITDGNQDVKYRVKFWLEDLETHETVVISGLNDLFSDSEEIHVEGIYEVSYYGCILHRNVGPILKGTKVDIYVHFGKEKFVVESEVRSFDFVIKFWLEKENLSQRKDLRNEMDENFFAVDFE